jgi:thiol-disulfide isomerase/thioredoxin
MAANPSRAAPFCPRINVPTRRNILSGTIGTVASLATRAIAAPPAGEIPIFESGSHQFTISRPQRQLPSTRLFRLEGGTIDLPSLRGRPILLNFWASWCAACRVGITNP